MLNGLYDVSLDANDDGDGVGRVDIDVRSTVGWAVVGWVVGDVTVTTQLLYVWRGDNHPDYSYCAFEVVIIILITVIMHLEW